MNSIRKKILLIDEVDVFFGEELYGSTYNPKAQLKSKQIEDLFWFI